MINLLILVLILEIACVLPSIIKHFKIRSQAKTYMRRHKLKLSNEDDKIKIDHYISSVASRYGKIDTFTLMTHLPGLGLMCLLKRNEMGLAVMIITNIALWYGVWIGFYYIGKTIK